MPGLTARQTQLFEGLKADRRVVTTSRVHRLNRALGAPKKTTARRDIAVFRRHGLLIQGGADDRRFYLLTRKAVGGQ
jgi:hypothetical protein